MRARQHKVAEVACYRLELPKNEVGKGGFVYVLCSHVEEELFHVPIPQRPQVGSQVEGDVAEVVLPSRRDLPSVLRVCTFRPNLISMRHRSCGAGVSTRWKRTGEARTTREEAAQQQSGMTCSI